MMSSDGRPSSVGCHNASMRVIPENPHNSGICVVPIDSSTQQDSIAVASNDNRKRKRISVPYTPPPSEVPLPQGSSLSHHVCKKVKPTGSTLHSPSPF